MHRSSDAPAPASSPTADTAATLTHPGSRLRLPAAEPAVARSPTATAVVTAFSGAIDKALDAIITVDRDPVASVHELRRAVRAARAILRVIETRLPRNAVLELRATLRSAIRETGTMRDRDVLPAALASLPTRRSSSEARAQIEVLLLSGRAVARRRSGRARSLAVLGARLSLVAEHFADVVPRDLDAVQLHDGLRRLVDRARRATRLALKETEDVARQHGARKRVRELAIALHMVGGVGGGHSRVHRRAARLARLSSKLGATLDLDLLRTFVREHARGLDRESAARLIEQLERTNERRRPRLLRRARRWLAASRWKDEVGWASNVS